jgi:hypothetical protein
MKAVSWVLAILAGALAATAVAFCVGFATGFARTKYGVNIDPSGWLSSLLPLVAAIAGTMQTLSVLEKRGGPRR